MQYFSKCPFCKLKLKLNNYMVSPNDDVDFYEYCGSCNQFNQWSKKEELLYCTISTSQYELRINIQNNLIVFLPCATELIGSFPEPIISLPYQNSFVQDMLVSKIINKEKLISKFIKLIPFS